VGTSAGVFAKKILELSNPAELHIIDITLRNFRKEWFSSALASGVVRLHEQDSVAALSQFPEGYFDWIYIDGNHITWPAPLLQHEGKADPTISIPSPWGSGHKTSAHGFSSVGHPDQP
jgi:hypothetical protein